MSIRIRPLGGLMAAVFSVCAQAQTPPIEVRTVAAPAPQTGPTPPTAPRFAPASLPTPQYLTDTGQQHGGYVVSLNQREPARLFYRTVFTASENVASGWNGDVAACNAGDTSADYKLASQRRINWLRAMAGVPAEVTLNPVYNGKAQQAALMMSAGNSLSHTPGTNWPCYSADGSEAAGSSNLSLGNAGIAAITEGQMRDAGTNNAAVGHRRWLIYPQTQQMGVGDIVPSGSQSGRNANAVWVFDGRYGTARPAVRDEFVAWPPPGYVPYPVVYPRWSFSYPGADFSSTRISMQRNGVAMSTTLEPLSPGAGENTLVWLPEGYTHDARWQPPGADERYTVVLDDVRINGTLRSFRYDVIVFDPAVAGSDTPDLTPSGVTALAPGASAEFTIAANSAGTEHQWRSVSTAPLAYTETAEDPATAQVTAATSVSPYTSRSASGARAFLLAHPQPTLQTLTLNPVVVPAAGATLTFDSMLGLATSNQVARVEVSRNEGQTWDTVYEQAGGTPEQAFRARSVGLSDFTGQTIRIRLAYDFLGGSYYPQTTNGVGWHIDNIVISGAQTVSGESDPVTFAGQRFTFVQGNSSVMLQARAGMYGFYDDWSRGLAVSATPSGGGGGGNGSDVLIDCVFDWAETVVPTILNPRTTSRTDLADLQFRHYTGSNSYLGVQLSSQTLLFLGADGQLQNLGNLSNWIQPAGCTP